MPAIVSREPPFLAHADSLEDQRVQTWTADRIVRREDHRRSSAEVVRHVAAEVGRHIAAGMERRTAEIGVRRNRLAVAGPIECCQ